MFSIRRSLTRAITFGLLLSSAPADTIVLKSGERIEGKILSESEQQLTIEVKVSAGITDERVVPRAEVERVEKVSPETEAYKAIASIQPGPNSLTAEQYDPYLRALQAFLAQYPTSVRAADVQKALTELQAEKKRVDGGERRLRGEWLSKAEVEREKVQLDGSIAFEHMKKQSAAGDTMGALQTFTILEKNYAGFAGLPEAIELARQLVASLRPGIERAVPVQKAMKAEKEKGFLSGGAVERAEMIAAYKEEQAQADAAVAAAESAGQWPPFIAGNEKSLKAILARITKESTRLAALPVEKMKKSVEATAAAKTKLAAGDASGASADLKEATALWPANEIAVRLAKEAAAQKAAAPKEVKPAPATPAPATPKPKATPKPRASAAAAPAAAQPEESGSFFMSLPGALGIVAGLAVVLGGVTVFKKMKARNNPAE